MLKPIIGLLFSLFSLGYSTICVLLYTHQRAMLYPAPASKAAPVKHLDGHGPVVVYFHGNAMAAGEMRWLSELLQMRFVAIEYPGYGNLPGETTEKSIYAAAEAQLRELQGEQVVLVGQSLGTGPAVEMARRGFGTKLVLMTPFTSIPDVAKTTMPYLPTRLLTKDLFDNAAKASMISMPVLVVHGDQDEVVPFRQGEKLARLFADAQLMTVPAGHHNDLWQHTEVLKRVREFAMQ